MSAIELLKFFMVLQCLIKVTTKVTRSEIQHVHNSRTVCSTELIMCALKQQLPDLAEHCSTGIL